MFVSEYEKVSLSAKFWLYFGALIVAVVAAVSTAAAVLNYLSMNPTSLGQDPESNKALEMLWMMMILHLVIWLPLCFGMVGFQMNLQGKRIQAVEQELAKRDEIPAV
jgi:heme/copper-type cytochrome/quinol oxidase subunit 2